MRGMYSPFECTGACNYLGLKHLVCAELVKVWMVCVVSPSIVYSKGEDQTPMTEPKEGV